MFMCSRKNSSDSSVNEIKIVIFEVKVTCTRKAFVDIFCQICVIPKFKVEFFSWAIFLNFKSNEFFHFYLKTYYLHCSISVGVLFSHCRSEPFMVSIVCNNYCLRSVHAYCLVSFLVCVVRLSLWRMKMSLTWR